MNYNIIECNDNEQYIITDDLYDSIKSQGSLKDNSLLKYVMNNPDLYCNKGLDYLKQIDFNQYEEASYDAINEILTYKDVEYNLCIEEYELEFDSIYACYEFSTTLENGDYIYLTWLIDSIVNDDSISNPPIDFTNPFVSEYRSNS